MTKSNSPPDSLADAFAAARDIRAPDGLFERIQERASQNVTPPRSSGNWMRLAAMFLLGNLLVLGAGTALDRTIRRADDASKTLDWVGDVWRVVEAGPVAVPEYRLLESLREATTTGGKKG